MTQTWQAAWIIASALVISAVGVLIWKKKKRLYVKVGKVTKLYFFPVKSLKHIEVQKGHCTNLGFEVNGVLDRSFMLINGDGVLISQREAPNLVLLTQQINEKTLSISTPAGEELKVKLSDKIVTGEKIVDCRLFRDHIKAVDCGDDAASFFQSYLNLPDVRLVRYSPSLPKRKHLLNNPLEMQVRAEFPIGFQDFIPFHMISQASIDDLNAKLIGEQVSVFNFRPNILIDECGAFEEDSWRYIKSTSGSEFFNLILTSRCLLTTNNPSTALLSKKEPLVTMRKYRIPKDPELLKKLGSIPCLGISCVLKKPGEISVGDDIFADVGHQPEMQVK